VTITVRAGGEGDRMVLVSHVTAGEAEQSAYRGRRSPAPAPSGFLVAEIDGSACGTLGWTEEDSAFRIVHVFVEPWARNVGVGDAMMAALLRQATVRGARTVGASALPGDRSMKNLFERNGLVAREILVERNLP
jgi:ribosomal protein S18 acetylase RimI-like enzyme